MKNHLSRLYLWSVIGPSFLACALCAILLHTSSTLWPLTLVAFLGLLLTYAWKRRGLCLSFLTLFGIVVWQYPLLHQELWHSFFLASIALSWVIALIGREEIIGSIVKRETEVQELHSQHAALHEKHQIHIQRTAREHEIFLIAQQASHDTLKQIAQELESFRQQAEEESDNWRERCESLSTALACAQEKERELEGEITTLKTPKLPVNPIIPQESIEEKPQDFLHMEMLYRQLKGQFEEKSTLLVDVRKQLFSVEGQLIAVQKEKEELQMEISLEAQAFEEHVRRLAEESRTFEIQAAQLEEIVTELTIVKKARKGKRKPSKADTLPEILQDAIDNKRQPQQFSLLD